MTQLLQAQELPHGNWCALGMWLLPPPQIHPPSLHKRCFVQRLGLAKELCWVRGLSSQDCTCKSQAGCFLQRR